MDLVQLDHDLLELQQRYYDWVTPISEVKKLTWHKRHHQPGYTEADQIQEIREIWLKQRAIYNPKQVWFPVREALLTDFINATPDERRAIRAIIRRVSYAAGMLLQYIHECAECIETPDDGWLLHSGLVAAAIEDYGWGDFRDTHNALSELAIAAREAGIDIEPHAKAVLELCEPPGDERFSIWRNIESFHIFALTAIHLMEE